MLLFIIFLVAAVVVHIEKSIAAFSFPPSFNISEYDYLYKSSYLENLNSYFTLKNLVKNESSNLEGGDSLVGKNPTYSGYSVSKKRGIITCG